MKYKNLALTFIILIGMLIRIYKVELKTTFSWDQVRDLSVVKEIIETKRPTLIGPVAMGEGGFFLGPLYYYLLIPFVVLLNFDPISLTIFSLFIELVTMLSIYFIVSRIFNTKTALLSTFFWALSFSIITNSYTTWNVSLLSIWVLSLLYSLRLEEGLKSIFALSLLTGISFHIHASIVPFSIFVLFYKIIKTRKKLTLRSYLFSISAFVLMISPLMIFDIRHDFLNSRLIVDFMNSEKINTNTLGYTFQVVISKIALFFSAHLFATKSHIIGTILIILYLYKSKNRQLTHFYSFSLIYLIVTLTLLKSPDFPEYYLNLLLIPITIKFGELLSGLENKLCLYVLFSVFAISNISKYDLKSQLPNSLRTQRTVVEKISEFSRDIDIRYELDPGQDSGIKYLLIQNGINLNENSQHKLILGVSGKSTGKVDSLEPVFEEHILSYKLTGFIVK